MPKGNHYGRTQTRSYTNSYQRVNAKAFRGLLTAPLGCYSLHGDNATNEHKKLKLTELESGIRLITFTINAKAHHIALKLDNRSVSNKLYITCPYCQKQRQSLYAIKCAYACRQCIGLHYISQSERPKERLMRRIRKLRKNLWGNDWPEINNLFKDVNNWPKPKGIHWKTFYKKLDALNELENKHWPMAVAQFKTSFGDHFIS